MGTFKLVDGCRPDLDCPCIAICLVTLARPAHGASGNARKLRDRKATPEAAAMSEYLKPDFTENVLWPSLILTVVALVAITFY